MNTIDKVKQLMSDLKISQTGLAERTGLKQPNIKDPYCSSLDFLHLSSFIIKKGLGYVSENSMSASSTLPVTLM